MRKTIESGDTARLRALVTDDPALVDAPVEWTTHQGEERRNSAPPLHFVCDALFRGACTREQALEMVKVLVDAGSELHTVLPGHGDTFLISASSLGAEDIGILFVELGLDVHAKGLFGATALHWSALLGMPRLARALVDAGASQDVRDTQYDATPLGWAKHAWTAGTNGNRSAIPAVVEVLGADPNELEAPSE